MKDQRLHVLDIVKHIDDATQGILNVPEFQRKYVWKPSKVVDLIDSLWRGYPIGILLIWESPYDSPRTALGNQRRWIVDGQQRVTSLALLFGKKPYWWPDTKQWNEFYEKYNILVNITKDKKELEFALTNPIRKNSNDWISVRKILQSDNLSKIAIEISQKLGDLERFAEIHEKLQTIKKIENVQLYEIIVDHELEDIAEIFSRLNTSGTKIRESDIIVALVAAKQQGWIRDKFDPFLKDLENKGFKFDPGVIIRTLSIIGHSTARLKDVPASFWEQSDKFDGYWRSTKEAINIVIKNLIEYGISSSDILPSLNALIPVFALRAFFPQDFNFAKAFSWFLIATRDGRYSGSAITALDQDTKQIRAKNSFDEAISELISRLSTEFTFRSEYFLEEYTDKFLRLIVYLILFDHQAKDWIRQDIRIGFDKEDNEINEGFKPEWHHIFPRKILKNSFDSSIVDSMANIAILNEKANRSFSSKIPQEYLKKHNVKPERLDEQAVPSYEFLELGNFEEFLKIRAENLAKRATAYIQKLGGVGINNKG